MPMDDILLECEEHMDKAAEHLHQELRGIRTGRASPALVEHIKVDYYGSPTDLKSIASISVPEATQLLIRPFAKQDLKAIEKAISDSKVGLTPHSDGQQLRLNLPALSTERRQQLAGQCKEYGERAKIVIRNARRDANKQVDEQVKAGEILEDEGERGKTQIQDLTKQYEAKVDEYLDKKRAEIMQV